MLSVSLKGKGHYFLTGKGKFQSKTGHEGAEGE
jgi:hypothetical protein